MKRRQGRIPGRFWVPKDRPSKTLDYDTTYEEPRNVYARAFLDWWGEDIAFDGFWTTFRTLSLYLLGVLAMVSICKLLGVQGGRRFGGYHPTPPFDERLHGVLMTAAWAIPAILISSAVYAWVGVTTSQRIANVVACAMAIAALLGVIVYVVKFY